MPLNAACNATQTGFSSHLPELGGYPLAQAVGAPSACTASAALILRRTQAA